MSNDNLPQCSVCFESLGRYGGPTSLPCGHNGCLQCFAHIQRTKPHCPICRAAFPPTLELRVNTELRDLMQLAEALTSVQSAGDGDWQAVTSSAALRKGETGGDDCCSVGAGACGQVALVPSAPPLHVDLRAVLEGEGDLMSLEPPKWAPDSSASGCGACGRPFSFFMRSRHHCRLCGDIFCDACSSGRMLLPPRFLQAEPQRVCGPCGGLLAPLQGLLAGTVARAVQAPVHDTTDWSVWRSLLNSPLSQRLEDDIYKSVNIVRHFSSVGRVKPERGIPAAVLSGCAGLAILSVLRVGAGWSCALGTGLVVARRGDGSWSPPSSILSVSAGPGWQAGAGLTDVVVVLRNQAAVRAFCSSQLGLGTSISIAAGPLGREAAAKVAVGPSGGALCCSYSCSRGVYAGVGLEGTLLRTRDAVNHLFYGRPLPARALLLSPTAPPPAAAAALYSALDQLMLSVEQPGGVGQFSVRVGAGAGAGRECAAQPATVAVAEGEAEGCLVGMEQAEEARGRSRYSDGGGHGAQGAALEPPGSPLRRGRAAERAVPQVPERSRRSGALGDQDVAGATPLWHAPSAPAFSAWDDGEPLPSLFD